VTSFNESIAAEIERYCASHPDAGDTLEGIAWWLMLQRFQDTRADIEAAAESLVRRGVLERQVLADGSVLFSCRPPNQEMSEPRIISHDTLIAVVAR
jgi:hypothetical protein